jgi:hypothetical protein
MKLVNGTLALEFSDLVRCGVPEITLKQAAWRGSDSWEFIQDPVDGRKRLVVYEKLKAQYKELVDAIFGNPYDFKASEIILSHLVDVRSESIVIRQFEPLSIEQIDRYVTAYKYIRLASTINEENVATLGFAKMDQFWKAICRQIQVNKVALPSHPNALRRKVREYREKGPICVVPVGKFGNQNTVKISEEQRNYLISLYSGHQKPSMELVAMLYNKHAESVGWPRIAPSTVRYTFRPGTELRQIAEFHRDPQIHKQKYLHSISTKKASKRNLLWESDGTKLNLFYRDEKGKVRADLEIYLVADSASEMILGYHFSHSEDHATVYAAYRMAINRAGVRPDQVLFDNGGAHNAKVTKEFISRIAHNSFQTRPYNGQSKTIEKTIGMWQDQVLRLQPSFTGMNITAKADDSRANMAWLKDNPDQIPTKAEAIRQAIDSIEVWNQYASGGKRSPIKRYEALEEGGVAIEMMDMVNMFYLQREQPVTFRKDGLQIEIRTERLLYMVYEWSGGNTADWMAEHCNDKFIVRYDPEDLNTIHLYQNNHNGLTWMAQARIKDRVARALGDFGPDERAKINRELSIKDDQIDRLKYKGAFAKAETDVTLGFSMAFKQELNDAEGQILVSQLETQEIELPKGHNEPVKPRKPKRDIMLDDDFTEGRIIEDDEL